MGPFHRGELALQEAAGVRERMEGIGARVIRDHMPDQHRELFEKLPALIVGALDAEGQPWATIVEGADALARTPDARTMRIRAYPHDDDPARAGLRIGGAVGILGIEPATRRRNRANGVVASTEPEAWTVRIHQSFGNCPKYIHARTPARAPDRIPGPARREGPSLSPEALEIVARSDTFFLASSSAPSFGPAEVAAQGGAGVDVSHRGGRVGFVAVDRGAEGDELRIPDYPGNAMFNTLGNLVQWPRAGLLLLDWQRGHLLQLAATAAIDSSERAVAPFPGAIGVLRLRVHGGWLRPSAMSLTWSAPEAPRELQGARGAA